MVAYLCSVCRDCTETRICTFKLPRHPPRKKLNFHSEREPRPKDHPVVVQLDGEAAEFVRGKWIPVSGLTRDLYQKCEVLQKNTQQLKKENNLLKLKIDILLDMLTEETLKKEEGRNKSEQINT